MDSGCQIQPKPFFSFILKNKLWQGGIRIFICRAPVNIWNSFRNLQDKGSVSHSLILEMRKRINKTPLSHMKFVYFIKMIEEQINQATDQLVLFLMFQKYIKDAFILHCTITLIKMLFQNTNGTFVKASVFTTPFQLW